jgi:radical SAM protein with 4Fe4S-binding SPASM domain
MYIKEGDYWLCKNNKKVTFRKVTIEPGRNNNKKKLYLTRPSDCKGCPFKPGCAGKAPEKRITITIYNEEYQRAIARLKTAKGIYMKKKRQSTVEPVFGSLTSFYGLRKINTLGISQANKVMLLAATAYNLKKMLKFSEKRFRKVAQSAKNFVFSQTDLIRVILSLFKPLKKLAWKLNVKSTGAF